MAQPTTSLIGISLLVSSPLGLPTPREEKLCAIDLGTFSPQHSTRHAAGAHPVSCECRDDAGVNRES